jgi:hypothetical protein
MKNALQNLNRLSLSLFLAALMGLSMNAANAGEVDGKGNPIPGGANGKSECSYSGQQDDPEEDAGIFRGDRVQSWGQLPKMARDFLRTIGMHPGDACNPKKSGN